MGNVQSYGVATLAACSLYFVYFHIYRPHKLIKSKVLSSAQLPSLFYLYTKFVLRALTRTTGLIHTHTPPGREAVFTVIHCRLEGASVSRFCSAAGYGWDYPDSEYRDLPLCLPDFLCSSRRLLLLLITDLSFPLSPAGLTRVRQTLKTHQPIDELKKGPFTLQVQVEEYRALDAGAEVDVRLSASARTGSLVWESVLTLLSRHKRHTAHTQRTENEEKMRLNPGRTPEAADNMKQVELSVPWVSGTLLWPHSVPNYLLLPGRLLGSCASRTAPALWMLSVCLAEIEKHRGVGVITAPISVSAHFEEPLRTPGQVVFRFWDTTTGLGFHMLTPGSGTIHVEGLISKV